MNQDSSIGRGMVVLGGCSVVLIVSLAVGTGACLLYRQRGPAAEVIRESEAGDELSEVELVRRELLVVSAELSDPSRKSTDLTRTARRLETLDIRLEAVREDPGYLKVRALQESVELQLELLVSRNGEAEEIPPLPPSTTAPPMDDRYVGVTVGKSLLLKGKVFSPSPVKTVRYGPGLFQFARKPHVRSSIGALDSSKGWKFLEVEIGITGTADLVEYSLVLLDDFHRAFPPYLAAEKYLAKGGLKGSEGKHAVWRDVHSTTSRTTVLWLHRVFELPADGIQNPILEVHRQGAAKLLWVQY